MLQQNYFNRIKTTSKNSIKQRVSLKINKIEKLLPKFLKEIKELSIGRLSQIPRKCGESC